LESKEYNVDQPGWETNNMKIKSTKLPSWPKISNSSAQKIITGMNKKLFSINGNPLYNNYRYIASVISMKKPFILSWSPAVFK